MIYVDPDAPSQEELDKMRDRDQYEYDSDYITEKQRDEMRRAGEIPLPKFSNYEDKDMATWLWLTYLLGTLWIPG